jgi:hypothetical protein
VPRKWVRALVMLGVLGLIWYLGTLGRSLLHHSRPVPCELIDAHRGRAFVDLDRMRTFDESMPDYSLTPSSDARPTGTFKYLPPGLLRRCVSLSAPLIWACFAQQKPTPAATTPPRACPS